MPGGLLEGFTQKMSDLILPVVQTIDGRLLL